MLLALGVTYLTLCSLEQWISTSSQLALIEGLRYHWHPSSALSLNSAPLHGLLGGQVQDGVSKPRR
uniref:Uncharacterized protein n=1 Tax=Setaria viridis TaxID=4556 RepID=A0A4V6D2Z3_SETVI|nr:hypothetical protein SEVIR_8G111733v2 [Setaria viridis]